MPAVNVRTLKSIAGDALTALGMHSRILGDRGVVVAFHRVSDAYRDPLTCGVGAFESFCRVFHDSFAVIPLAEMVTRLERGQPLGGTLAITFDDGYRDNYESAAPILRSLRLPATFFVVTDFVESDVVPWWDGDCDPPPKWMTWDQLRRLRDDGFDIGGHTRTHVDLGTTTGDDAEREIAGSRGELEARLDIGVELFAYPYGRVENMTEANRALVRRAGFRCCASCHGGTTPRGGDAFHLPRIPISSWFATPGQFVLETALGRT